jgi:hypothetical protein
VNSIDRLAAKRGMAGSRSDGQRRSVADEQAFDRPVAGPPACPAFHGRGFDESPELAVP